MRTWASPYLVRCDDKVASVTAVKILRLPPELLEHTFHASDFCVELVDVGILDQHVPHGGELADDRFDSVGSESNGPKGTFLEAFRVDLPRTPEEPFAALVEL